MRLWWVRSAAGVESRTRPVVRPHVVEDCERHDNEAVRHSLLLGGEVGREFWTYSDSERQTRRARLILKMMNDYDL